MGTLAMIKNKKIFIIIISFVVLAFIMGGYFVLNSKEKQEVFTDSVYEQLGLNLKKQTTNEENEETGIVLNDYNDFLNEFQISYEKKIHIDVLKMDKEQATLSITTPDMYSILETSEDANKILEMIDSENCPMVTNEIKTKYEMIDGKYHIEENEELIYSIYGGMEKYFEEKGL